MTPKAGCVNALQETLGMLVQLREEDTLMSELLRVLRRLLKSAWKLTLDVKDADEGTLQVMMAGAWCCLAAFVLLSCLIIRCKAVLPMISHGSVIFDGSLAILSDFSRIFTSTVSEVSISLRAMIENDLYCNYIIKLAVQYSFSYVTKLYIAQFVIYNERQELALALAHMM
jgi:hypothetical protein